MIQRLQADDRGVSEVIGAILVFAVLVLLLSIMQTQAVPNQNSEVEFKHSLDVQSDLIQFHQIASSVAADGSDRSVSFNMGTGYPSRLLFFNPPRVQGQLETSNQANVTIANLSADNGEVDDYVTDSANNQLDLETRRLEYTVNYNEFPNDPTTRYEYGVLYSQYDEGTVVENSGNIIDGTTINLLYMAGNYSESSTTEESLSVQGVSAPARSVTITGTGTQNCANTNDPVFIELPSQLNVSQWQDLYGASGANNICSIQEGNNPNTIEIRLDPRETYDLRMSRIGLEPGTANQTPHYIVPVDPGVTSAGVGQSATVEYEVRDRFNNPVSGVVVDVPGSANPRKTNDRGRVSVTVSSTTTTTFNASISGQSANAADCGSPKSERCNASYSVQVPGLNLNPFSQVVVKNSTTADPAATGGITSPIGSPLSGTDADVAFVSKTGSAEEMQLLRINHYSPDPQGHNGANGVTIADGDGNTITAEIGGGFVDATSLSDVDEEADGGTVYQFQFSQSVNEGDYFVLTVIYEDDRALYFISPEAVLTS